MFQKRKYIRRELQLCYFENQKQNSEKPVFSNNKSPQTIKCSNFGRSGDTSSHDQQQNSIETFQCS